MLKYYLLFIAQFLVFFNVVSQDKIIEKELHLKMGFGVSINRPFIEGLITNDPGLKIRGVVQPIGFSIGIIRVKYDFDNRFSLNTGFDLFTVQGVNYYYYGSTYTSKTAIPQLKLSLKFKLNKLIYFSTGCVSTINIKSIFLSSNQKNDYFPMTNVKRETFSGGYLLPIVTIGIDKVTKNKNDLELYFSFSKGLKPMSIFTLERFQPYSKSFFTYKGTKVQFGVNWYFNRK